MAPISCQNVWYYHVRAIPTRARLAHSALSGTESAFWGGFLYVVAGDNDSSLPGLSARSAMIPRPTPGSRLSRQN